MREFLVCEGSQRRLVSGPFSLIEFAGRMGPPHHQAQGRAGQGFTLGNSSVSGRPQVSNGCQEIRSKPQFPQGRNARDRMILWLNLKLEGRLGAATTGISLRRPQCLALGSSCLGWRAGSMVKSTYHCCRGPKFRGFQ